MDPRQVIRIAAENDNYIIVPHALGEADKDSVSICQVEDVMIRGIINQSDPDNCRYRLKYRGIQIVAEIIHDEVVIVTVMRDK